jgi:ubiquinone/menaquinone biosynthesis C-methylase UbiE
MNRANNYDRYAAARQTALKTGQSLPHRFVEKPAMRQLIPDLHNKRILMLGCGTGEESVLLESFGGADMTGIDTSAESVRLANDTYPNHQFMVGDMHQLPFDGASFDFVYSSLTVHYSATPLAVYEEIMRVLKPGGSFQFSISHPMRWASERTTLEGRSVKLLGYSEGDEMPRLYGDYSSFKEYSETFPSGEVLKFWVGPPSFHFGLLRRAGFRVNEFIETKAIEEAKTVNEAYYTRFSHFPQFTVFSADKPT